MRHLLTLLIIILFPLSLNARNLDAYPDSVTKITKPDQFALRDAFINRDWVAVHGIYNSSENFVKYDIEKIAAVLKLYDSCKLDFKESESPLHCLFEVRNKWRDLPGTFYTGLPTVQYLNSFKEALDREIKKEIELQSMKEIEAKERTRAEKKRLEEEREKQWAEEEATRIREIEENEKRILKEDQERKDRIASRCPKKDQLSEEEIKIFESVSDGENLNFTGVGYALQKLKKKPLWWECSFPHVLEAKKIPFDYRGRPVQSYGKIIQILTEKTKSFDDVDYITHGIISDKKGNPTYFFTPGKADGINEGNSVVIEGYFVQNYNYPNALGFYVTAPLIVGNLI